MVGAEHRLADHRAEVEHHRQGGLVLRALGVQSPGAKVDCDHRPMSPVKNTHTHIYTKFLSRVQKVPRHLPVGWVLSSAGHRG